MAIIIRSGFVAALQSVAAYFTANGVDAKVDLGWKKRQQQINQGPGGANRVIFIPSAENGDAGQLGPPRFVGQRGLRTAADQPAVATVKSLFDWSRTCQCSVWGVDTSDRTDEAKQIEATETLLEWTLRAIHYAPGAFGEVSLGRIRFTYPTERSFGCEALFEFQFRHPIYDVPADKVYPNAAAVHRAPFDYSNQPSEGEGDT